MKKYTIVLVFLIFTLINLRAQTWSLKLSSNVELRTWRLNTKADKEEKPLAGADIKLYKGSAVINQVSSDNKGDFTIMVPPNGEFILMVAYPNCNTKKFSISTLGVPDEVGKNNYKPTFSIGGFIMAKPFPGIDYSGLQQSLVKVEYKPKGKNFDDDESVTDKGLNIVSKIAEAENNLIEKFCTSNKNGDIALTKPDCPLAKACYEKSMVLIPGEQYPVEQLPKVGLCLKDAEAAAKKATDEAKAKAETTKEKPKDADKKAIEDAVAKAMADKAAKEQAESDKLVKAAAYNAQKKAEQEKLAESKAVTASAKTTYTNAPKPKGGAIKIKEKSEKEKEDEKERLADAKAETEDIAAEREKAAEEKLKLKEKEKAKREKALKQKEGMEKAKEEDLAEEKAAYEKAKAKREEAEKAEIENAEKEREAFKKEEEERIAKKREELEKQAAKEAENEKAENEKRKRAYEEREKEAAANLGRTNSDYSIPPPLGSDGYKDLITKGDDYFKTKRYPEAKKMYEEALKLKPKDVYAASKLAEIAKMPSK
jgi:hypothetical protein